MIEARNCTISNQSDFFYVLYGRGGLSGPHRTGQYCPIPIWTENLKKSKRVGESERKQRCDFFICVCKFCNNFGSKKEAEDMIFFIC